MDVACDDVLQEEAQPCGFDAGAGQGRVPICDPFAATADWFMRRHGRLASSDSMEVHDDGEGEVWKYLEDGVDPFGVDESLLESGILFGRQMQLLAAHQEGGEGEEGKEAEAAEEDEQVAVMKEEDAQQEAEACDDVLQEEAQPFGFDAGAGQGRVPSHDPSHGGSGWGLEAASVRAAIVGTSIWTVWLDELPPSCLEDTARLLSAHWSRSISSRIAFLQRPPVLACTNHTHTHKVHTLPHPKPKHAACFVTKYASSAFVRACACCLASRCRCPMGGQACCRGASSCACHHRHRRHHRHRSTMDAREALTGEHVHVWLDMRA